MSPGIAIPGEDILDELDDVERRLAVIERQMQNLDRLEFVQGTPPALDAEDAGRIWRNTTDGKTYIWTGAAFVVLRDTDTLIQSGDIAVGAITAGSIAAGSITADKIAAGTITATQIAAGSITGDRITAHTVTATQMNVTQLASLSTDMGSIDAGVITGATIRTASGGSRVQMDSLGFHGYALDGVTKVFDIDVGSGIAHFTGVALLDGTSLVPAGAVSGPLTSATLAAAAITGQLSDSQLAAVSAAKVTGQIVSTQISDGAISTPKLAAGAVTASTIAADTITAAQIATGAITATELASGSVTTAKLVAGAITSNELASGSVTTLQLAAGAVTANTIAAGAIQATHLSIGTPTVVPVRNGNFSEGNPVDGALLGNGWTLPNGNTPTVQSDPTFGRIARFSNPSSATSYIGQDIAFPVGRHVVRGWVKTTAATGGGAAITLLVNSGTATTSDSAHVTGTGDYTLLEAVINATTAANVRVHMLLGTGTGTADFANLHLISSISNTVLGPDSVTTDKILTRTLLASDIATGALTANEIASATITAGQIAAGTITATQIATATITASQMAANSITATQIAANAVTAGKINAGAIDAFVITGATIQTTSGNSGTKLAGSSGISVYQGTSVLPDSATALSFKNSFGTVMSQIFGWDDGATNFIATRAVSGAAGLPGTSAVQEVRDASGNVRCALIAENFQGSGLIDARVRVTATHDDNVHAYSHYLLDGNDRSDYMFAYAPDHHVSFSDIYSQTFAIPGGGFTNITLSQAPGSGIPYMVLGEVTGGGNDPRILWTRTGNTVYFYEFSGTSRTITFYYSFYIIGQ